MDNTIKLKKHYNRVVSIMSSVHFSSGVSPRCVSNRDLPLSRLKCDKNLKWFLMRISYGRERRVYEYLIHQGVEVFYPTYEKSYEVEGKKWVKTLSLIPNVLFVHSNEDMLKQYVGKEPFPYFHYYYKTYTESSVGNGCKVKKKAIIVPNNQMDEFIKWYNTDIEDKHYLNVPFKFKIHDKVRVTDGPFKGLIGNVVRFKGQTRVGINIDEVGFICTNYVPKSFLEKV